MFRDLMEVDSFGKNLLIAHRCFSTITRRHLCIPHASKINKNSTNAHIQCDGICALLDQCPAFERMATQPPPEDILAVTLEFLVTSLVAIL